MAAAAPANSARAQARTYRIFLSSPSDVRPEREAFAQVVDRINNEHGATRPFEVVLWEHQYYTADATFQSQIPKPSECELVVCIFWKSLGTDLPESFARGDGTLPTGTEYEFEEALEGAAQSREKLPDVLAYKKTAKVQFSEEHLKFEKAQRDRFLEFWRRWFYNEKGQFVAAFQSFEGVTQFEAQVEAHLRQWLRDRSDTVYWTTGSPFRGLKPFDVADHAIFFGRHREVERTRARLLTNCFAGERFLLVVGASGSGKSSLVRAGLIPRLSGAGGLSDFADELRYLITSPAALRAEWAQGLAESLFSGRALAAELREGDFDTPRSLAGLMERAGPESVAPVHRALQRASDPPPEPEGTGDEPAPAGARRRAALLVLVDQLEEVFAWPQAQATAFLELLERFATSPDTRVLVVATMRSDFQHRVAELGPLQRLAGRLELRGPAQVERTIEIAMPSAADLREMIVGPARAAGLVFQVNVDGERDLQREIEREARPSALPAVQYLLAQLYEHRSGNLLTLEAYDRLGGSGGVMAARGEAVLAEVSPDAAREFDRVARTLVTRTAPDAPTTAIEVDESTFGEATPEAELVAALKAVSLLRSDRGRVRIAHESLIEGWARLRDLVDRERRLFEIRERLTPYAERYARTPATPRAARRDQLLRGFQLAEASELIEQWGRDGLGDSASGMLKLIDTSLRHDRWRRRRTLLVGWGLSAVFAALSVLMILFWQDAKRATQQSEADLAVVRSQQALRDGDILFAVRFGIDAYRTVANERTRSAALAALMQLSAHFRAERRANGQFLAWIPGDDLLYLGMDGTVRSASLASEDRADDRRNAIALEDPEEVELLAPIDANTLLLVSSDGSLGRARRSASGSWTLEPTRSEAPVYTSGTAHGVSVAATPEGVLVAMTDLTAVHLRRCAPDADLSRCEESSIPTAAPAAVALSRDGQWLALGRAGALEVVQVGPAASDPPARLSLPVPGEVVALGWSADGDRLAAGTDHGELHLFDAAPLSAEIPTSPVVFPASDPSVSTSSVATLAFSPRGRDLAYACGTFDVCVRREADAAQAGLAVTRRLVGHRNDVTRLAWSPDGAMLSSQSAQDRLITWSMTPEPGAVAVLPSVGTDKLLSVATDRARRRIAAGNVSGEIWVWPGLDPWAPPRRLPPPDGATAAAPAVSVGFADDGTLAAVYEHTGLGIWAGDDLTPVRYEPIAGNADRLAWVHLGEHVAVPVQPRQIWLVPRSGELRRLEQASDRHDPRSVIAAPDDPRALLANYTNGSVWRWQPDGSRDAQPVVSEEVAGPGAKGALSLSVHPGGRWLAATRDDTAFKLYDLDGGPALNLGSLPDISIAAAFSPDGALLAVLTADATVTVWKMNGENPERWLTVSGSPQHLGAARGDRSITWVDWWDDTRLLLASAYGTLAALNLDEQAWATRARQLPVAQPAVGN